GVLAARGFIRVRCGSCGHERLVPFSCRRRGWCPSCGGRRMSGCECKPDRAQPLRNGGDGRASRRPRLPDCPCPAVGAFDSICVALPPGLRLRSAERCLESFCVSCCREHSPPTEGDLIAIERNQSTYQKMPTLVLYELALSGHSPVTVTARQYSEQEHFALRGGLMQPQIAFCSRCRGMRVGWNQRYVLHSLRCRQWRRHSSRLFGLMFLTAVVFLAFPQPSKTVDSIDEATALPEQQAIIQNKVVQVSGPVVRSIEAFLTSHKIPGADLKRLAQAIVAGAKKHDLDPRLIASVVIVESRGNPFAISGKDAIGVM